VPVLAATETDLALIKARVDNGTLSGADKIGLAVGPALKRYRMRKHFQITITDTTFTYTRAAPGSPRKPRWTGSTSCAPASPTATWRPVMLCAPQEPRTGRKGVRIVERP
jgi:hypothetical protein